MTNTLVLRSDDRAFEPTSIGEAMVLAGHLVASRLMPPSVATAEAAFALIVTGRELGLTAMQAIRSIHIIKGRPCLSADLILALVKRSPVCKTFQLSVTTDLIATYRTHRESEDVTEMSFTIDQARRAGLLGNDNWKKFPEAMLRARCIAALARAVYPDVVLGIYETSELDEASDPPAVAHCRNEKNVESEPGAELLGFIAEVRKPETQDDGEQVVAAIRASFAIATSLQGLNSCAPGVTRAYAAGKFSAGTKAELLAEFKARKVELQNAAMQAEAAE